MTRSHDRAIRLFSYGTLQLPDVQRATFGRLLDGEPDSLVGYVLAPLAITSAEVIAVSGKAIHTIARRTGRSSDRIAGTVFRLTEAEIEATDRYEVDAYARVEAELASGASAFAYVGPDA